MSTLSNIWPAWANDRIELFHGTNLAAATLIVQSGIDLSRSKPNKDFGRGFYTTTKQRSAALFAERRKFRPGGQAVVRLRLQRQALSSLQTMAFVRADLDALDFWSFVYHCREVADTHMPASASKYDVVYGPVARRWFGPVDSKVFRGYDQISFHTKAATDILNDPAFCERSVYESKS